MDNEINGGSTAARGSAADVIEAEMLKIIWNSVRKGHPRCTKEPGCVYPARHIGNCRHGKPPNGVFSDGGEKTQPKD